MGEKPTKESKGLKKELELEDKEINLILRSQQHFQLFLLAIHNNFKQGSANYKLQVTFNTPPSSVSKVYCLQPCLSFTCGLGQLGHYNHSLSQTIFYPVA